MVYIVLLVIFLILLGYALALFRDIMGDMARYRTARFRARKWCNPPRGKDYEEDERMEWDFIKNVLLLNNNDDPLIVSESSRKKIRKGSIIFLFILLILLIGVVTCWQHLNVEKYEPDLLPFAVLVSAVMVAIGTFFTIRVNGRASSRQEWIKDVRVILADLASGMPTSDSDQDLRQRQRSTSEHKFRKLELHLNPSEKMHRSLLYAISLAYDADWLNDDEVEKNLRLRNSGDWRDDKLRKAGIIRLSQVALKREWEQTKRLR